MSKNEIIDAYRHAKNRLLLLDYDGVLAPIMPLPEQAAPSKKTRHILEELTNDPHTTCVVISGRPRETLDEWLGDLCLSFAAEHGLWRREYGSEWGLTCRVPTEWKHDVEGTMHRYEALLPGSFVEEKYAGVAFHYRNAALQENSGTVQALIADLQPAATRFKLTILNGKKVVEAIPQAVNKGMASKFWLDAKKWDFILGVGDDETDEALFDVLPSEAYSVKVGEGVTLAKTRITSQGEFMSLLESLAQVE
jgi:trehalose 6-phosphate synthase/phosphatase